MTRDYSAAIDAVFGQQEESGVATAANIPFGAVDTSGGISAALDAEPGMVEQAARERLTPPVAQESPVSDYADPTAGWYTPPEESLSQGISTEALRGQMAEREILRHAYLPEGPEDDGTGGLLRASFMLNNASRYSQDDVFTAATAAAALGMPYDMTLESLPTAKDMLAEFTPANIKNFAPGFLRLVQYDYDAAMLWRHDLPTANSISRAFESFFADDSRLAALGRGLDTVSVMGTNLLLNLGRLGLEGLGSLVRGVDENYRPAELADKPIAAVLLEASDSIRDAAQAISRAYKDRAAKSPLAGMRVWDNPEILLDARWWLENTPAAVASLLPILGAYVKGGAAAAGLTGLALNSNEVYADLLDDGLQDDAGTRLYALLGGTAMSALDVVGLSGIFGGKPAVKDAVKASLVAAAKGGLKEKASHIGKRAGQAYLFEGSTEWLQNLIKAGVEGAAKGKDFGGILSDMSEAVTEVEDFILGGLLGGFIGGGHARAQVLSERDRLALLAGAEAAAKSEEVSAAKAEVEAVVKENAEAQRRMAFAQTMLAAADATDNSAMHQADPAVFEREAEKLIPEDARALWLDVDVVQDFVEGDLSRLDALGLTGQDMADALQTQAGMVQVSTSRLLSRFAGDERALLLQNARMVPGGMTLTEAQAFDPQKRAEAAAERIRARNRANAEISRERTRIKDEFVRAGYAAHLAEYYATMHAEQAKTFADRYGLDAARLLQERSIVRQEAGAGLAKDALLTPMVQATDASVVDFSRRVSTAQEEKKSYFRMNPATGLFGGLHVDLPADTIRHKGRRHPDMTDADMERLPRVLEAVSNRQAAFPVKDEPRFAGKGILGWAVVDGQAYGVIVESVSPTRGIVATYFKNTEENIKNWIEKSGDKNKAVTTPAALWPAQAPPVDGNALRERPVKPNIPTDQRKSNTFDQIAFHGTPHRFDKFTLDHIGEGEGVQAHGWGLYFAGNREVSEGYRAKLTERRRDEYGNPPDTLTVGKQQYLNSDGEWQIWGDLEEPAIITIDNNYKEYELLNKIAEIALFKSKEGRETQRKKIVSETKELLDKAQKENWPADELSMVKYWIAELEKLDVENIGYQQGQPGQLFAVDIPENDVLLDEDKKLNNQPEAVRAALQKLWTEVLGYEVPTTKPNDMFSAYDGRRFYRELADNLGGAEAASRALNEAGVKGITYDGRQDGRCFVVFDDQAIKVLQTYYQFIGEQSAARGAVSFDASGASVLSIFEGAANLSTPIHESAHIFINDLIRVVADGWRIAEQRYTQDYMAVQNDAGIDDVLKQRRQRILLKRWNRHKMGIIRAREDLSALVDNANAQREAHSKALGAELPPVTLEDVLRGTATPEQLRTLQEVNAVSFEGYVREGKAPSGKLAAVFHKMRQWLAALYRLATIHGVKPTPEVRRVFDRMLATDEAIHKSDAVSALAAEGEFLAAVQDADIGEWTKTDRINFKASLNQESEYDRLMDLYEQAEADVSARMDKATLRDRNKRWRAYYNEGKELAAQDVYYEILAALSVKADNPLSGISREWLQRQYGHAAVQDFMKTAQGRKILNKHGGQALDAVGIGDIVGNMARAKTMGIADADGLYNYLYDNVVVRRRNLVNDARGWADQRMADDDAQAEAAGDEPGDAYRKYLEEVEATVLRLAARQGAAWRTPEQQARWVEEHRAPLARVRQRVKEVLRGKRLRDIQPNQFVGEVRKALLTRNAALTAGNALDALAAVDRARTALESWIEANRIRKEQEAFERLTSRLAGLKRNVVVPEAWTAIQDILERFGLVPPRRAGDAPLTLADAISALCADSAEINGLPAIADWLLDEKIRSPYKNLTPEQLHDVSDVLKMLEHTGREALTANRESEAAQIKEVADGGATAMDNLAPISVAREGSQWRKWQDWMRLYFGGMLSAIQWQLRQADGFSNLGPKGKRGINEERLWGGIVDGESRREVRMRGLVERMEPIIRRLTESAKAWEKELGKNFVGKNGKPLPVPEVMRRGGKLNWTADRVIALCLNLGNEGNVLRLREGYPDMAPATLAQLVGDGATRIVFPDWQGTGNEGLLSAQDWRDVQEIGNILHSQWSDIQATHARMFGFKPRGVDARPLNIRVNGETLSLKGWYYPAVYDPSLSEDVKLRQQREDAVVRTEAVCAAPAAKKGFTYGRSNTGGGAPLLLETGVIMAHLNDVTRFIELAEIVRFADRVTRSPQWRDAYIRAFGQQDYDAIRPNLKGVVLEERPSADAMSKTVDWLRERVVPWGLSFNIKTAILQSTALFPAMNDLGATNVLRGVAAVAKGRYALVRQIWEQSPYMKSRAQNIDQDLRKTLRGIDARTRQKVLKVLSNELTWQDVVDAGMLPLISVDMAASAAVWMAGYNREMSMLMNSSKGTPGIDPSSDHHTAAVRAADMAVKAVNPDFNPSSRSQFLRSRGLARMLNIFSSAVVLFAQRRAYNAAALRQAWKASAGNGSARLGAVGTYARYEVYDFALQGVAMGLIMSLVYGEDDPQKYATNMLEAWLDAAAMRVPVFNNMITGLVTGETWRGMSTVYQQPWELAKRVSGAMHKGDAEKLTASMADVIGFLCKVPFSRVLRNAGRGHEQWLRGDGTPFSVVMPRPNSY